MGSIVPDEWLARHLGKPVYRISVDEAFAQGADEASAQWGQVSQQPVFAYTKVGAKQLPLVHHLEKLGFQLVDTNVIFQKPIQAGQPLSGDVEVRFAVPEDQAGCGELARHGFIYDRFHADYHFAPEIAGNVKAEWVGNFFAGQRGDQLVVASLDGQVVGFNLLLHQKQTLIIDLIATHSGYQRRGIAQAMIAFAEHHAADFQTYQVGTQVANTPSVNLYEKMGFRLAQAQYVFHYHRD
jgi:GNAT superfamily N-acetyltransferase